MSKKLRIILLIVVLVVVGIAYGIGRLESESPKKSNTSNTTPTTKEVTKTGIVDCLKPKDTDRPQTLECAMGLEDNGSQYGLQSEDPSAVGSIPTGTRVRITGTLTSPASESKYQTKGTIKVKSIERL